MFIDGHPSKVMPIPGSASGDLASAGDCHVRPHVAVSRSLHFRAERVPCPTCTAAIGKPCHRIDGHWLSGYHAQRSIAGDRAVLDQKNTRRHISLKPRVHARLKAGAKKLGRPVAQVAESGIARALDALGWP